MGTGFAPHRFVIETTTGSNYILLGILMAVVLQAACFAALLVVGMRASREFSAALRELRHMIQPLCERADTILTTCDTITTDVKGVSARAAAGAERVATTFGTVAALAALTPGRVGARALPRIASAMAIIRGIAVAYRNARASANKRRGPATPSLSR